MKSYDTKKEHFFITIIIFKLQQSQRIQSRLQRKTQLTKTLSDDISF